MFISLGIFSESLCVGDVSGLLVETCLPLLPLDLFFLVVGNLRLQVCDQLGLAGVSLGLFSLCLHLGLQVCFSLSPFVLFVLEFIDNGLESLVFSFQP